MIDIKFISDDGKRIMILEAARVYERPAKAVLSAPKVIEHVPIVLSDGRSYVRSTDSAMMREHKPNEFINNNFRF